MKTVLRTFVVAVALLAIGSSTVQAAPLSWDGFTDFSNATPQLSSNTWQYRKANDPATESYDFMELKTPTEWATAGYEAGVDKGATTLIFWCDARMAALGWRSPITGTVDVTYSLEFYGTAIGGISYSLYDGTTLKNSGILANQYDSTGTLTQPGVGVVTGDMLYLVLNNNGHVDTGTRVVMTVTEVPEPTTLVLLAAGPLFGFLLRRKPRRA